MRHSGKRRFPAIFLRPLSGSAAAPPAPIAPHHGRAKAGGLRAAQGHSVGSPPGQARFSPRGPDRFPRPPQPLEGRSPRTAGLGPGIQGRPPLPSLPECPCPAALAPRRPRAALAAHSPPRGLAASARRPGAGPCPSAAADKTLRDHGC